MPTAVPDSCIFQNILSGTHPEFVFNRNHVCGNLFIRGFETGDGFKVFPEISGPMKQLDIRDRDPDFACAAKIGAKQSVEGDPLMVFLNGQVLFL